MLDGARNCVPGRGWASNPRLRIFAEGHRYAATAAVITSFSTPIMTASSGAWPRNVPLPQPGPTPLPRRIYCGAGHFGLRFELPRGEHDGALQTILDRG